MITRTVLAHISEIRAGDTVMIDGQMRTVSNNDIRRGFLGVTLFGDSYRLGTVPVQRVEIMRAMPSGARWF